MKKIIAVTVALLLVTGCSTLSMSGYGGSEKFRCSSNFDNDNEPYCNSISENYDASVAGLLNNGEMAKRAGQPYSEQGVRTLMNTPGYSSGTPIRSQNEIGRVWIAPYLDSDGDLVDQNFVYVVLNQGKWLIEHNQQQIVDEYRPVRLLGGSNKNSDGQSASRNSNNNDRVPDVGMSLNLNQIGGQPVSGQ